MTYDIKDTVWIHMGERRLVEGRVVEIIDLEHLDEGHDPNRELYIIEIKTGIDDIYEVRDFEMISPDSKGPINLFRKHTADVMAASRLLKKIGVTLPAGIESVGQPSEVAEKPEKLPGKKRFYAKRKSAKSTKA